MKQQLAKLSKCRETLEKEYMEAGATVEEKTRELAQLEMELEEAWRLIMQPSLPPTPPPSQAPRGHTSPRVSEVASSGMAADAELLLPTDGEEKGPKRFRVGNTGEEAPSLQQVLAAEDTFSAQDLGSIIDSFRQRQLQLDEQIASEQRELKTLLDGPSNQCVSGRRERRSRSSTTSPKASPKVVRKWTNWLREDLGSRPYAWLRPDFVPPSPFLVIKDPQTQSSRILVEPHLIDAEFRNAFFL